MSTYTAAVTGVSESPTKIQMAVRQFSFAVDEPPALGGTDAGPNPVEFVLASVAGCLNVVIHMVASERGVVVRSMKLAVTGTLDTARLMGQPTGVRAGFESVAVTTEIDADASDEEIDAILAIAETRCPVADNLGAPTPVSLRRA